MMNKKPLRLGLKFGAGPQAWEGGCGRGGGQAGGGVAGAGWGGLLPERNPGLRHPEVEWLLQCGTGNCCGGFCLWASDHPLRWLAQLHLQAPPWLHLWSSSGT